MDQDDLASVQEAGFGHAVRDQWMLDPEVVFLNHGSFGARLHRVFNAQQQYRRSFEERPVAFLDREFGGKLEEAQAVIGDFLGMSAGSFGFVTNATCATNAVLSSFEADTGGRILSTDHIYGGVRQAVRHHAQRLSAEYCVIKIPVPTDPGMICEAIADCLRSPARLLIIDHVASPTAIVFPIREILQEARSRGTIVLVDGAHAPGMIPLDLDALGADYYVGNLHKWMCAPPGAAFLHVHPEHRDTIHPTVISHFYGEGMAREFAWQGTRDVSAWLAAADAVRDMETLGGQGGWAAIMAHNHALAVQVGDMLCDAWQVDPLTPADGSMLGSMVSVSVPAYAAAPFDTPEALQAHLADEHGIEVPIIDHAGTWLARASCQVYNTFDEYCRLADAIRALRE